MALSDVFMMSPDDVADDATDDSQELQPSLARRARKMYPVATPQTFPGAPRLADRIQDDVSGRSGGPSIDEEEQHPGGGNYPWPHDDEAMGDSDSGDSDRPTLLRPGEKSSLAQRMGATMGQSTGSNDATDDDAIRQVLGLGGAPQPKPSLKQRLLKAALMTAPVALGAALGKGAGATGAGQGVIEYEQQQQAQRNLEANRQAENQRSLAQRMTDIAKAKMQEQAATQRQNASEAGQNARQNASLTSQAQQGDLNRQNQQTLESQREAATGKTPQDMYAAAVQAAIQKGVDPATDPTVQHWQDAIQSTQPGKAASEEDKEVSDYLKSKNMADTPANRVTARNAIQATKHQPEQPNEYTDWKKQHPGGSVEDYDKYKATLPTAQTRNMAQTSATALPLIDEALTMTDQVADKLGPTAGRWNDFWQGKVGASDPEFAAYKAQMAYVTSAITLAHSRGRVSNLIFDEFNKLYDAGKQSPENMKAALGVGKTILTSYANSAGGQQPAKQNTQQQPTLSNFHVNPKTGERIGWNGTAWVPAPKQ